MRRLLVLCCLVTISNSSWADTPEELIAKLGSPRYLDREAAGEALLKLGPAALPALKAAAEASADAEIRERAAALLEPLMRAEDTNRLLAVKKVSLNYSNAPLQSIITEFKTKTGIPVQLVNGRVIDPARRVTIPACEMEPWEALSVILNAAGLKEEVRAELPGGKDAPQPQPRTRYYYYDYDQPQPLYNPGNAPILLVDGKADDQPCVRRGGVRILALPSNFPSNRVVRGAGRVVFHLDVAPVPSTGWHQASSIRVTRAEDEDGRPVFADLKGSYDPFANQYGYNPWGWGGRRAFWGGGGMIFMDEYSSSVSITSPLHNPRLLAVTLRTNDRTISKLRKFDGSVLGDVHIPNSAIITIEKMDKSIGTAYPGPQQSTLTIQEFKTNKDGSVTVRYRHDSFTQWALSQARGFGGGMWMGDDGRNDLASKLKFYDVNGKEVKSTTNEGSSSNSDGIRQSFETTIRFPKTAIPSKVVLTGTKVTAVEIPFSMTNVAIP